MENHTFNLPPPPGFRGFDPEQAVRIYQRRLPHWRQRGATYFVTFRLADSIPQTHLRALKRWRTIWERNNPEPRSHAAWETLAHEITARTERWLDEGYGACELGLPRIAELIRNCLCKFQDDRYFISCSVVMPKHVHAVIKPLASHELEHILRDMKGYMARRCLGSAGIGILAIWRK